MYAGVVHAKNDIRYETIETPVPKAGEVLVKVKYTGICGSDVPRVNGDACHFFPNVLGHEFSGVIAACGDGVTTRKVGDRVAGVPLVPCMQCEDCRKGNFALCKHYSFVGSRRYGSFAEYVAVPAENTVPIAAAVSFEMGAFFEPATVALHGLECADYRPGKTVAILGAGTIGTLTMQWAKIFGAKQIVVFDRHAEKLARCMALAADAVIDTSDADFLKKALALTDGRGFDYVYETAGSAEMIRLSYQIAANCAQICMIGTPKSEVTFSVAEWENVNRKEFHLTGSWMSYSAPFPGHEWDLTAHYFASGDLKIDEEMIFQKIPLQNIAQAFAMYQTPGAVKGKILIDSER